MAVASDDEGRIYFKGVDVYLFDQARPLMPDADKAKVTLKKGLSVVVFKIIDEQNTWQGAMRLLDSARAPCRPSKSNCQPEVAKPRFLDTGMNLRTGGSGDAVGSLQ